MAERRWVVHDVLATRELIWTLTTHGKTARAFASLESDYQIDKQVISTEVGSDFLRIS